MSGLGEAAAVRLAQDGVTVVTMDIADGADLRVDVTDADAVRAAAARVGPVDILVNSAGIVGPSAPLWEIPLDGWEQTFAVRHSCRGCGSAVGAAWSTSPAWPARTAIP
jgi:NAD(P)-dependent dehydrogenase (short-subunit alcohol dehydrogenase family)